VRTTALSIIAITSFYSFNAAAEKCSAIRFERIQNISVQNLRRLTDAHYSRASGYISFQYFDYEDGPYRDKEKLKAIGFLMAGIGDLAENPVAGYLWVADDNEGDVKLIEKKKKKDDESDSGPTIMTFSAPKNANCPTGKFTFKLLQNGEFYGDGKLIGKVE